METNLVVSLSELEAVVSSVGHLVFWEVVFGVLVALFVFDFFEWVIGKAGVWFGRRLDENN